MLRAVLDTNVIDAALRSRAGASYELLWQLSEGRWKLVLCNTLCTEYEEVLRREAATLGMTMNEIGTVLDDLCALAERHQLRTAWIPVLKDPDDEARGHLAFETGVDYIVTHNLRHLDAARKLGTGVLTPKDFLNIVRNQP